MANLENPTAQPVPFTDTTTVETRPLTLEENKEKEETAIRELKVALKELDDFLPNEDTEKVYKTIFTIRNLYGALKYPIDFKLEYRKKIAKLITDHGKFVPIVCDNIVKVIQENNFQDNNENPEAKKNFDLITLCSVSFLNYSNCSDLFREQYGKQEKVIQVMAEKLLEWAPDHLKGTLPPEKEKMVKRFLGIAHNLVIYPENITIFRKYNYVQAVAPYLESGNGMYTLSALATLADILNEEECHLLQTNEESIKLLLFRLGNASGSSDRKDAGWTASELGRAVGRLARNDCNKKMLVSLGVLPLLLTLTTSNIKIEQEESIEALWVLAFDEENQPKMVAEPNLIETIVKLRTSETGNIKKVCNGILWTLRNVLEDNDKFKHLVKGFFKEDQGHVMMSYQWDHQDIVKKISQKLRENNRTVWMDIDNMEGSTVQAMAKAIEGAQVVICCMTQRYKDSPNCRAEAEYAYQLRRPIIPLILERDYHPDGWLGFILGTKLFYDFSGKYSFHLKIDELMRGVRTIYDPQSLDQGPRFRDLMALPPVRDEIDDPQTQKEKVKKWTSQQVGTWLKKYNLDWNTNLNKLSGKEIVFLQNLRNEAVELFYHTLRDTLEITQLEVMADFTDAIKDLTV